MIRQKELHKIQKKAFYWYEKAAQAGNTTAQLNVAIMYDFGQGTTKDLQKAFTWYKKKLPMLLNL